MTRAVSCLQPRAGADVERRKIRESLNVYRRSEGRCALIYGLWGGVGVWVNYAWKLSRRVV
jgi:hypothetical protein